VLPGWFQLRQHDAFVTSSLSLDIGWSSVGCENPNNRIEVQVRGNADAAWQRNPCYRALCHSSRGWGVINPLVGGRT